MTKEEEVQIMHRAFGKVILSFYQSGRSTWEMVSSDRTEIKKRLAQSVTPDDKLLSNRLNSMKGDLANALVPLELRKDRGCLMYAEWDFSNPHALDVQLSVLILPGLRKAKEGRFVGYRFDSPHEHQGDSGDQHKFWHAQPIRALGQSKQDIPAAKGLDWMPDDVPAFPVAAWSPVSLLAAAIYSVLGGTKPRERIKQAVLKAGYVNVNEVIRAVDSSSGYC